MARERNIPAIHDNDESVDIHEKCYLSINENEVKQAIDKLKLHKAEGSDGISAELVKDKSDILISVLTSIINESWDNGTFPEIWCKGAIQLLHKKASKLDLDNYRQITVQCTLRQFFCRIIETRMKVFTDLSECHIGFREKRSSADNLFIIKQLMKRCTRKGSRLGAYFGFIDFKKAFDSLHVDTLMAKLRTKGAGGNMLGVISSMYERSQSAVRHEGRTGEFFNVERGVAQGCILSPLLFAIYLDDLLISLQKLQFENGIVANCLAYADDLLLLARTTEEMEAMLKVIEKWCDENSMAVNTNKDKSAIMPIGESADQSPGFKIHGQALEVVDTYKYIGFALTNDGKWDTHLDNKIASAKISLETNARFLADGTIPVKMRMDAGQALVLSQLKYGEAVINVPSHMVGKMESIQTKMHRMILGMPRGAKAAAMRLMLGRPTLRVTRIIA